MRTAAEQWRDALEAWAIPEAIVQQATQSPWIHPPVLFELPREIAPSPSHDRAREALGDEASVLDVGCGGGIGAFALVPQLRRAVGVDHQPEMLTMFRANGARFGVETTTVEGFWPDVAAHTARCEVAVSHHVVYNVGDIVPFLAALDDHASRRVVLEMPTRHPLASMSSAWQHFWQLERPSEPTPAVLLNVLRDMGISANLEQWEGVMRTEQNLDQAAHFMRIRLCLAPEREDEVREFLAAQPPVTSRSLATIWWDTH